MAPEPARCRGPRPDGADGRYARGRRGPGRRRGRTWPGSSCAVPVPRRGERVDGVDRVTGGHQGADEQAPVGLDADDHLVGGLGVLARAGRAAGPRPRGLRGCDVDWNPRSPFPAEGAGWREHLPDRYEGPSRGHLAGRRVHAATRPGCGRCERAGRAYDPSSRWAQGGLTSHRPASTPKRTSLSGLTGAGASVAPMGPTRPDASGEGEDARARPRSRGHSRGWSYGCSGTRTEVGCRAAPGPSLRSCGTASQALPRIAPSRCPASRPGGHSTPVMRSCLTTWDASSSRYRRYAAS